MYIKALLGAKFRCHVITSPRIEERITLKPEENQYLINSSYFDNIYRELKILKQSKANPYIFFLS